MSLQFVDFLPRLLQAEPAFSTLSLTGDVPGPRYEEFDYLIQRANDWLVKVKNVQPLSCEVVELDGVYHHAPGTELLDSGSSSNDKGNPDSKKGMPAFIRILRLWYKKLDEWQLLEAPQERLVLEYTNLMPSRLESTPRAFGPKFLSLNDTIQGINRRLQEDPEEVLAGRILNIQTCVCRFSTKNCGIDPDRTFWMASNTEDMHICYFFRIFMLKTARKLPKCQIGYKDFTPSYDWKSKRRRDQQPDSFQDLLERAKEWLGSLGLGNHPINYQTLDHHAYFRCVRDTPGHENRALNNPHFRSTQWGQMDYAKILRVYHIQYAPESDPTDPEIHVYTKTFHIQPAVALESIQFGGLATPELPLAHSQIMHRINDWIKAAGVNVTGAETIKVCSNLTKVPLSAEDTIFQSSNRGRCYMFLAIRLYFMKSGSNGNKLIDLSPEPKNIRLDEESCNIL